MKRITITKRFLFLLIIIFSGLQLHAQSLLDKRINELVDAMTTQEKIDQLINNSFGGTPFNTRLGIPGFAMDDGPHGKRYSPASSFPTGIAMVSTWDQDIAVKEGEAMGLEFWAYNANEQLGPCIDICRDPRSGRAAESGGEDSYLCGHIGKSVAIGIQKNPVIATVKHYMGEGKQANRSNINVIATDRWLMDFSGYNFRAVVQEGGVMSIMGAYNLVNDKRACQSTQLLETNLRQRWGYPFYVVSDWNAISNATEALKAGLDLCMGSSVYETDLPGLLANGSITIADIDKAVKHVLRTKIMTGMLDYFPVGNQSFAKTAAINATNLLAAQKSIILLKNGNKLDGTSILPLKKTGIKIALIGPNALGKNLNCYGSSETNSTDAITAKDGIETIVGAGNVQYAKGCDINSTDLTGFTEAKTIAASADVVIFAGGLDATQEGEGYGAGGDRTGGSIMLPGIQQQLITELAAVNPNLVVVIQSGGVCSLNPILQSIKGLVYSFYSGQKAGTAIADVLFGNYNPAGRMPVSMAKKDADLPAWDEQSYRKFTNNLDGGYRWLDEKNITPDYAFGFGLSYTTYAYGNLVVSSATVSGQPITVSVDVTNNGSIAGEEVAQLYLSSPSTPNVWMPKKQLRGFKRISLQAGETKTVTFQLCADDFYFWNGTQYQAQSGNFIVRLGGSSDNLPLTKSFTLTDGEQRPDLKITQIYTMPRYPLVGQQVSFYALVKNQGNATNSASSPYKIDYKINGVKVASSDNLTTSIAPGQVQFIASTGVWTTTSISKTTLSGEIAFNQGASVEWDATNNSFSSDYEVFDPLLDPKVSNLAYQKPVTVSSFRGTNVASNLVDGDMKTRWESDYSDNESALIDLEGIAEINRIAISWEAAFAKSYKIESSLDGSNWTVLTDIKSAGVGGTESYVINSVQARYIKLVLTERTPLVNNAKYAFSIYEVAVNGTLLQKFPSIQIEPVESILYLPYAKTILNGINSGGTFKKEALTYQWSLISGPTDAVIADPASPITIVMFKTVGTYVFRLSGTNADGNTSKSDVTIVVQNVSTTSDLALMKPTTASSIENLTNSSGMAVDGDAKTRWASSFANNQWWQVDFQHQILPSTISILWEGAYAKNYNIEISADGKTWQSFYSNNAATGGTSTISNTNNLSGRLLKVNCIERATNFGNSFYTFNVGGAFVNSANHAPMANAGSTGSSTTNKYTLNGSSSSDADNDPLVYSWQQIAGPTTALLTNANSSVAQVSDMQLGEYYFKLTVDDSKDVDFDLVKVKCTGLLTKVNAVTDNEIVIFPNPATERINISGDVAQITLYSIQGQLVYSSKNMNVVNVSSFIKGMYLVKVTDKQGNKKTFKLEIR